MERAISWKHIVPALVMALGAISYRGAVADDAIYILRADVTTVAMPDGVEVPMWGFALDSNINVEDGEVTVPGPMLAVADTDDNLIIRLKNNLTEAATGVTGGVPVSLVIPGLSAALTPVRFAGGPYNGRIRSLTYETPPGNALPVDYVWTNVPHGTYMYHSGTQMQVQVQMGLYGGVKKDYAPNEAFPGYSYEEELIFFYSEIDRNLHDAVANGEYGPDGEMTSTLRYYPQYFLVNGQPFTPDAPIPTFDVAPGTEELRIHLRLLNAGLDAHTPALNSLYMDVIAEDAKMYPQVRSQYSVMLPAGKTVDAAVTAPPGRHAIYDRALDLVNSTGTTGGMFAYFRVFPPVPPVANDDAYETDEDVALVVDAPGVLDNDVDENGDPITAILDTPPANGGVVLNSDGSFTYTPNADYFGADSFTYYANDGALDSENPATVSITVHPVNDLPVADDQAVSTDEDTPLDVTLAASDVEGDALTYDYTQPANGTVTGDGPLVTYTPNADYNGPDSFTFTASDAEGPSNVATVTISVEPVNDLPAAEDQAVSTDEDTPLDITLGATDTEGDALTYDYAQPANGTVTGGGPLVTYTPNADFNGVDTFTFTASDAEGPSNVATITITVNPVNDLPVADDQAVNADEDTPLDITLVANDVEGDALTYAYSQPANGTVTGDGPLVSYTPNADFNGVDSFTFTASDAEGPSNVATVTIDVGATNDLPVAEDQAVSTDEDTPLDITLGATDTEGDALTYDYAQPANGAVTGDGPLVTYTPNADFTGVDTFTFTASDAEGPSNVATITITVNPVNDLPVADDQAVNADEDVPLDITLGATDAEGDALTYDYAQPANGTVTGDGPLVTYTPNADFNGVDSFTFTASDAEGPSNVATVTIDVGATNDLPVAEDQAVSTDEDVPLDITLGATDTEGDALTYNYAQPANGTVTGTGPLVTYTPNADFNGVDTFTFAASDAEGPSNVATISITVNPVNDLPVADDQAVNADEDTPLDITLVANDADGDALTYDYTQPANGTVTGDGPLVTYTPNTNYNGPDSFTFTASDAEGPSNVATVTIDVGATNDLPVAEDQAVSTDEDVPLDITLGATDTEGDALTYYYAQPANGTVTGGGPLVTYTPNADFTGVDTFTFTASDAEGPSNVATIAITVNPINDLPVADDQAVNTDEDTPLDITLGATDTEGDALTYNYAQPANGTVTGDGPLVTYTPNADYYGPDSFTFTASDGEGPGNAATVSVTVLPLPDAPVAVADDYVVAINTPLIVNAPGVLDNDYDPDGDIVTAQIVTLADFGASVLGADGAFIYVPPADWTGTATFTYRAIAGGDQSEVVDVTIEVTP